MGTLIKKYRIFWITETKEIINDYESDYSGSLTMYPDDLINTYFESDIYQDIIDKINIEDLIEMIIPDPLINEE